LRERESLLVTKPDGNTFLQNQPNKQTNKTARPTQEEGQIYHYVSDILSPSQYHLEILRNYNGCGDAIRKVGVVGIYPWLVILEGTVEYFWGDV
jgi:hypothetical protein